MLLKVRQIMASLGGGGRKNNIKKTTRQCMKRFADPFWALFAILGHVYQKEEWFPDTLFLVLIFFKTKNIVCLVHYSSVSRAAGPSTRNLCHYPVRMYQKTLYLLSLESSRGHFHFKASIPKCLVSPPEQRYSSILYSQFYTTDTLDSFKRIQHAKSVI